MFRQPRNKEENERVYKLKDDLAKLRNEYTDEQIEEQLEALGYDRHEFIHLFVDDFELRYILNISEEEYIKMFGNFRWRS